MRPRVEKLDVYPVARDAARRLLWRERKIKERPEACTLVGFYFNCSDVPEPDKIIELFNINPRKDFIHSFNGWPSISIFTQTQYTAAYPCVLQLTPRRAKKVSALLEAHYSFNTPTKLEERREAIVSRGGALYTITRGRMNPYEFIENPKCDPILPRPTPDLRVEPGALLQASLR